MLRTHRAGKGRGGWGLGSRQQEGPRRAEDQVQDLSRLTGPEWAGKTLGLFPSDPLIPEGPSLLASLLLLPPSLPPMPVEPTWPEGTPEGRGPSLAA